MPSPEVINLTLSDDETQPDHIRSNQDTSMPTPATNRFRTSSSTPTMSGINRTWRILPVIQGTFAASHQSYLCIILMIPFKSFLFIFFHLLSSYKSLLIFASCLSFIFIHVLSPIN